MTERRNITLTINGTAHTVNVEPRRTLVDVIRDDCGQTGTHIGCEHGVCGACTVLVDEVPIRACITLALSVAGKFCTWSVTFQLRQTMRNLAKLAPGWAHMMLALVPPIWPESLVLAGPVRSGSSAGAIARKQCSNGVW